MLVPDAFMMLASDGINLASFGDALMAVAQLLGAQLPTIPMRDVGVFYRVR